MYAALTSLRCWVGPIAVWRHPYDHPDTSLQTPSSQHYAYIEGDTLEAATHAFAQQQHSEVSLVVVRTEHAGECNRGILAIDGSESEELLHAQIVQQLVSIVRSHTSHSLPADLPVLSDLCQNMLDSSMIFEMPGNLPLDVM